MLISGLLCGRDGACEEICCIECTLDICWDGVEWALFGDKARVVLFVVLWHCHGICGFVHLRGGRNSRGGHSTCSWHTAAEDAVGFVRYLRSTSAPRQRQQTADTRPLAQCVLTAAASKAASSRHIGDNQNSQGALPLPPHRNLDPHNKQTARSCWIDRTRSQVLAFELKFIGPKHVQELQEYVSRFMAH